MLIIIISKFLFQILWNNISKSNSPEHDIVKSLDPCRTPSHVCIPSEDLTGIVPSPDSILVLNWPRAFRLGCGSAEELGSEDGSASWGEKIRASPQGAGVRIK